MPFETQVLVLYAALNGYFDKLQPEQIQETEAKLLDYVKELQGDLLDSLKKEKQITEAIEGRMKEVILAFTENLN